MAENTNPAPETIEVVEKAPSKFRTALSNHKRKLVATGIIVGGVGAAFVAGKRAGQNETLDLLAGSPESTSTTDTSSEA